MNLDDIIQTVNTGDFKELDLWDKLVQYFVQYWDGEPDIFQQVRGLMQICRNSLNFFRHFCKLSFTLIDPDSE
jgi:hypothetical protein